MNWIKYKDERLKEGTICRTSSGMFIVIGEANTSLGLNDEFTVEITHYTEDYLNIIEALLDLAKDDFEKLKQE